MTLPGIFPTWLGECEGEGTGVGGTTVIDAYTAELTNEVPIATTDDTVSVIIEDDLSAQVSQEYDAEISGDIDVDLECS